ncbi:SCO2400 family protein [Streptomyces sp. NPDC002521]
MDYCSSCRRHLNGALVCPGCGAYAPDIAPPGTRGSRPEQSAPLADQRWFAAPAPEMSAEGWFGTEELPAGLPAAAPSAKPSAEPSAEFTDAPSAKPSADVTDAPAAPQGRAARRRQLARWKKNQRRAVVATAVALVGGGLTVASMDRGSGGRAQAASAPDNRSMGLTEHPSAASSGPASAPAQPAATHRHTPATPAAAWTPTADVPHQQTLAAAPHTAQPAQHPHTTAAVTAAHPTTQSAPAAAPVPLPRSTTPSSSGTQTQPTSSAPTGTTGSGGTSASTPDPASPSSHQLCLVLVCLG